MSLTVLGCGWGGGGGAGRWRPGAGTEGTARGGGRQLLVVVLVVVLVVEGHGGMLAKGWREERWKDEVRRRRGY